MTSLIDRLRRRARDERGFTMIIALMVMFITSLIVAAIFIATNDDVRLTKTDTEQKKAYYAALAGISAYKYHLNKEPNYWSSCPAIEKTAVPQTSDESYAVKTLHSTGYTEAQCKEKKQYAIIEGSSSSASGTFRIESTGTSGNETRTLVATFDHPGFLNYVYFTRYEVEDPADFPASEALPTAECEQFYATRKTTKYTFNGKTKYLSEWCIPIEFASEDEVKGPLHTDDASEVCGTSGSKPTFGRPGKKDKIEINGGTYAAGGCSNSYNNNGVYTENGEELNPPETDSELSEIAGYTFTGKTELVLHSGTPNTITITKFTSAGASAPETKNFPASGIIYVANNSAIGCGITYTPFNSNYAGDTGCGNVYVSGTYTESLTIAAENDVIINGNITTTTVGGTSAGEPEGAATLGLIATNFVRLYHPVELTTTPYLPTLSPSETKNPASYIPTSVEPTLSTSTPPTRLTPTLSTQTVTKSKGSCSPSSQYESYGGTCYSKTCSSGTYFGEGKCAKCNTGYEYISSEKKCGSTSCATGTTYFGEGKCAKCNTGYEYIESSKKCLSTTCNSGYTFNSGTGECISTTCESGYEYRSGEKKCAKTSCTAGYQYFGEGKCGKCKESEFSASEKKCGACANSDQYLGEGKCEYEDKPGKCDAENAENGDPNELGTALSEPIIDAAILSTHHSFIVDNYQCGAKLGKLTVWGSIAQYWRGPVGTAAGHGYLKNYNYDERLLNKQPPSFLTPTSTTWKLERVTAPPSNFSE